MFVSYPFTLPKLSLLSRTRGMSWKEFRNCPSLPSTCAKTCSHRTKVRKRRALPLALQSPASTSLTNPSKQGRKALLPTSPHHLAGACGAPHAPREASPTKPRARGKRSLSRTHPKLRSTKPRRRQQPTRGSEQGDPQARSTPRAPSAPRERYLSAC